MTDYIVRATAAGGQIRGFASTTREVVEYAREAHNTSPVATAALGRLLTAAGMSFLGLGIQPPTPEWGNMISTAKNYIREFPYMTIFPGAAIMVTILALNLLGDGLRDALDPKLRY